MKNQNLFDVFTGGSAKFVRLTMKTDVTKKMKAEVRKRLAGGGTIHSVKTVAASCNWNYGKVVNDRLVKEGKLPRFSPLPSWATPYGKEGSALFYKTNDPKRWYLRYYNPTTLDEAYYINDVQATPEQVREIKEAFYKKGSGRQGLSNSSEVLVRMVKFCDLIELYYDKKRWSLTIPAEVIEEVSQTA